MKTMDLKEKVIINHYKNIISTQKFDEFDVQGFLITIRRHLEYDNSYSVIKDAADLVAHRERDRGLANKAMKNAVSNNYATIGNSKKVKGYNGIDYKAWETAWKKLFKEIDIDFSNEILLDITLCFYSLAQKSTYGIGVLELGAGKNNKLALISTEGKKDSLFVVFSVAGPYNIKPKRLQIIYDKPVWTKRAGKKLRLRDEDGYII